MMRCSVEHYEGSEPYIFVSYAHRDWNRVFPIIERLAADGFRIWYDEGIDPGSEWITNIGEHLSKASAIITFLTASSVNSQNCREEIMFARASRIPVLAVHLENVEIDQGLKLALMSYQAVFKYTYDDEERFFRKVEGATMLKACRNVAAFDSVPKSATTSVHTQQMPATWVAPQVQQVQQMPATWATQQAPPAQQIPQASQVQQMPTSPPATFTPAGAAPQPASSNGKRIVVAVLVVIAIAAAVMFVMGGIGQKSQSGTSTSGSATTSTSTTTSTTGNTEKPNYMTDVQTTMRAFLVDSGDTYDEYIIVRSGTDTGSLTSISDITHFYMSAGYTMEDIESFDVESIYPNFNSFSFATKTITEKETLSGDGYYEVVLEFNNLKRKDNLLALDAAGILTIENKNVDNISGDSVCDLIIQQGGQEIDKSEYLDRGLPII